MSELDSAASDHGTPWPAAFGERLRRAREDAGMSQEQVQEHLGYPTRSLTRWENGWCDPGFEKVVRMADLYGVSTDWVAGKTTIKQCIQPGMVMLDSTALEVLTALATSGKTIDDIPMQLLRKPGINYAVVVPDAPTIVAKEAAHRVEDRMQSLWRKLGGQNGHQPKLR